MYWYSLDGYLEYIFVLSGCLCVCVPSPVFSMDGGAWWATVHGVANSCTWLGTHTHRHPDNTPQTIWKCICTRLFITALFTYMQNIWNYLSILTEDSGIQTLVQPQNGVPSCYKIEGGCSLWTDREWFLGYVGTWKRPKANKKSICSMLPLV